MTALRERAAGVLARPALAAGRARVADAVGPVAWASLACGVAYAVAALLLGHAYPFFAAVAAFACLGFSPDVKPRRVGEVALGVSMGVAIGELIQLWLGSGPLQIAVVVFCAAMIARLIDPSPVLTTQSVVQAIVVLGLPAMVANGGPVGRWTDALLGGVVALLFSLFIPKDPRRRPRRLARGVLGELGGVLTQLSHALRTGTPAAAVEALSRGRRTQVMLVEWANAVEASGETARLSPTWRRHHAELVALAEAEEFADRAIRTSRVLARRVRVSVVEGGQRPELADLTAEIGAAAQRLGLVLASGLGTAEVVGELEQVAARLVLRGERDPLRHTLVSLLRSVTFDLLRAAGCTEERATAALG